MKTEEICRCPVCNVEGKIVGKSKEYSKGYIQGIRDFNEVLENMMDKK